MKKNPFKFGSIVDGRHFTNRTDEISRANEILKSDNHLIIISPRRYGKTSLIMNVAGQTKRPIIALDIQMITSVTDFAAQLLKRIYRIYPFERVKQYVRNFQIIPTISVNPISNAVDVSFHPESAKEPVLEDVLNLMEQLSSTRKKLIVIFDEFQDILRIDKDLLRQLRSIMQHHRKINYVFLGSQESMIRGIFETKKSPFYHFGMTFQLGKIPQVDFDDYLRNRFKGVYSRPSELSRAILQISKCHPYYTQQLAFVCYEILKQNPVHEDVIGEAREELIRMHDMDYERIWASFNNTDKKLLIGLSDSGLSPLSVSFYRKYNIGASSTSFSSLKRLKENGFIVKSEKTYEIEDPFFSFWLKQKREV